MAKKFYYDNGSEKVGPITGEALLHLREQGELSADTWVRRADSETWRPLSSVDLTEEEEEERNPSMLRLLKRSGLLIPLVVMFVVFIVMALLLALLLAGAVVYLWPVLLVLLGLWLLAVIVWYVIKALK